MRVAGRKFSCRRHMQAQEPIDGIFGDALELEVVLVGDALDHTLVVLLRGGVHVAHRMVQESAWR